jgi:hypothetical protein
MRSTLPIFALALAASAPALATEVVPVQHFRSVQLRGGGDVTIVPGAVQRVTILNGSTRYTQIDTDRQGRLNIQACNASCPHNYNLRIQIETPKMPVVAVEAGGTIVAGRGFPAQHDVVAAVSAGGTIDLRALDAMTATAAVNAGGDIYVRPRSNLTAAVNSGGDIHYSGNPQVTMAVRGGGNVSRD